MNDEPKKYERATNGLHVPLTCDLCKLKSMEHVTKKDKSGKVRIYCKDGLACIQRFDRQQKDDGHKGVFE
jgi:hypothetical protein